MAHDETDVTYEDEDGPVVIEEEDGTFVVRIPLDIATAFGTPPGYDPEKYSGGFIGVPHLTSREQAEGVSLGVMVAYAMTRIAKYDDTPPASHSVN
jgi:hypothetical protein